MQNPTAKGRPRVKGKPRNFKLLPLVANVLQEEADRTGYPFTSIVENAILYLGSFKAANRDNAHRVAQKLRCNAA